MAAGSAKALPQQLDLTIISTAFFGIQFPPGTQGKIANAPRALSSFRILVLLIYFCLSMFWPALNARLDQLVSSSTVFGNGEGGSIKRTNNSDRAVHDSFIHHGKWRGKRTDLSGSRRCSNKVCDHLHRLDNDPDISDIRWPFYYPVNNRTKANEK